MKKTKTQKGITLIALIITIVVLVILAVVAISEVKGESIVEYAKNARDDYQIKADEEQETINGYLTQIEGSLSEEITWKKTSEGNLAVGSTVVTSTGENFYVIGFKDNNETVVLLAKDNLKADGSAQDTTGATNPCAFSTVENLDFSDSENLNNNSTVKVDTTSAVYKAMQYGKTLGVTTGRLMLRSEAGVLGDDADDPDDEWFNEYENILYGINGKSSGEYLDYWLGTAYDSTDVFYISGGSPSITSFYGIHYGADETCGVRPVVEISISKIS